MKTILIIDDEESIRESLMGILLDEGFRTLSAESGEQGLGVLREEDPDLILLDIWMPGIDGIETLRKIREITPDQLVIMMSGHGTIETAVKATKLGAYDFIEKPLSLEKLLLSVQNALTIGQLVEENRTLKARIAKEHEMIGNGEAIRLLKEQISIAAPTSGWVLIPARTGPVRNWWPGPFMPIRNGRTNPSSRSTARPSPRSSSNRNSSATKKAPLPAPQPCAKASSIWPTKARYSSMKSAT